MLASSPGSPVPALASPLSCDRVVMAGTRACRGAGSRSRPEGRTGLWAPHRVPTSPRPRPAAPTKTPRTERHYPVQDGTAASMVLLALTSLYAGSAGLTPLTAPVVRAATDLLKSGRSCVVLSGSCVTALTLSSAPKIRAVAERRGRSSAKWRSGRGSGRVDHRHQPVGVGGLLGGRPSPVSHSTEDEQAACRRDAVSWCGIARPTAGCTVAQRSTADGN